MALLTILQQVFVAELIPGVCEAYREFLGPIGSPKTGVKDVC